MRNWLTKNREIVIPALTTVVVVLLLANLVKHGWLTSSTLGANKDSISALSACVTIVGLIVGGVFSYYRFFRGRTFVRRADLRVMVTVISASKDHNLHAVTVEMKNIGTLAIWEPRPVLRVSQYGPNGVKEAWWKEWGEAASSIGPKQSLTVIDSGEVASFINDHQVAKTVWAVKYVAFVEASGREVWKRALTVPNAVQEDKPAIFSTSRGSDA